MARAKSRFVQMGLSGSFSILLVFGMTFHFLRHSNIVIPAKAGIQLSAAVLVASWAPAFAGVAERGWLAEFFLLHIQYKSPSSHRLLLAKLRHVPQLPIQHLCQMFHRIPHVGE